MTILVVYIMLTALDMALMIWGQQTFPPIIPTFPPPPTMNAVINESVIVLAGEPVTVSDDQRVTIDCSEIINRAIMSGIPNPTVNWLKDGKILVNGSEPNVMVSSDRRRLIITDTLLAIGGQRGNEGNYTCDVCTNFMDSNCNITTPVCVCGEPNISPPTSPALVTPGFIRLTCGQDVVVPTLQGVATLLFQCDIFNGSSPVPTIFKDGVRIRDSFPLVISPASDADFGTYTFRLSTDCCGSTMAVSRIIRQGDPPDIDEGPFMPLPPALRPGDRTVRINTPAYIVDGFNLTLECNLAGGTPPITIKWLRDGQPYQAGGNNSVITVFDYVDGEEFTCRANNIIGFDIKNTTIKVFVLKFTVTVSPTDSIQGAMVGSPLYIECAVDIVREVEVESSSIMISWSGPNISNIINDSRVSVTPTTASGATYTSNLQFIYLMEGDEGTYTCNVIISEISGLQSVALSSLIIPSPTVNLNVTSLQKVGQPLTMLCNGTTVRGIASSVYIIWRRGNTTVDTTRVTAIGTLGNVLEYRDSYTITQLSTSDDGVMYECTLVIQASSEVKAHDAVRLIVLPRIYVHPKAKIVEINNDSTSVTFFCMADEASSYYWLRETGSIPSDATGVETNKLTLHSILPLDSGHYQCVAENENGKTYSNYAMFTVIALPPVVRIVSETEIKVKKGQRVEFVCSATGVGSVYFIYQWFLNGLPVTNQNASTLVINAVSENDTGDYKCFVRNQYNATGQSGDTKLVLDQLCDPVTVNYTGFSIMWNETQAGITAEALCTGHGLNGTIRRRCIRDHLWEEFFDCFRQKTKKLLDQAINLTLSLNELNETEKIMTTSNIANALVNVTTPAQEPIFAQDINLAVNTLSTLNNATETFIANLMINDTFFEDTTSVINNLLSDTNQESWKQLERSSPSTSQVLVGSAEQITRLLSKTLTNNATKATKTRPNIIIKAERVTNDSVHEGYMFPDENDNLTAYNGGSVQIMVSSNALQNISSQELTIASTVIRNGSGLRLPSSNNRLGDPISPIFSLQINPLPDDLQIFAENPIMLMFDVDQNAIFSEQNIVQDDTIYDVSCNFYDNTLVTNDNLNQIGGWSADGLTVDSSHSNENRVTCLTTHLTSFAVLVSIQNEGPPSAADKALSIISYIGCSISLVFLCISIVFLSYTIYKAKDNKNHLFIHLNLCIALALGLVVFIAGIENATRWKESCKFVAALLQYLFISAFCWMLCEGVMLYMMLVTVFGNKLNKRRFFFVLGWGPAFLIVGISAGIAHEQYGTDYYCWIKSNDGAIAAFIAPIVAIMLINCVFFAITLRVLCQQKTKKKSNKDTVKSVLKAAVLLLPLLGMTWIIGIFAVNNDTQLFAWIFTILNSLQGVFIFLLHVIRNKQVVKEIRVRYNLMRRSEMFSKLHSLPGSGSTGPSVNSSKGRALQNTSSMVSGHYKNVSTTTSGFSSKALEMSLKDEAVEDSQGGQIKFTTLEESIIEEHNVGMVRKDLSEEKKKSITEKDGDAIVAERNDPDITTKD